MPRPERGGDGATMNGYRPITLGTALGKIFSQVMLHRLDKWAEAGGWRADSQFGFRQGVGTAEAVFVMRHAVDVGRQSKRPVFAGFVDFKQAYDSVDRDLLWRCIEGMGVHGASLMMLKQMYMHTTIRVRAHDGVGSPFESEIGVKQGDPLSPLLFGLFIDRICSFLDEVTPDVGVRVGGKRLKCLLYADDLVLLAHDREGLQDLLDALANFCRATRLRVNVDKTVTVTFHGQWHCGTASPFVYDGSRLPSANQFVYLGVVFHSKGSKDSARHALRRRFDKAKAALFAMMGRCQNLRVHDTRVLCTLFDTLCLPSLLYGAEAWGPEVLLNSKQGVVLCGELEHMHALFLRMTLWLKKSTPHHSMRQELGRVPIGMEATWKCAQFWNKLVVAPESSLLSQCWHENMSLGEGSWSASVTQLRQRVMRDSPVRMPEVWDVDLCWDSMLKEYQESVDKAVGPCMEKAFNGSDMGSLVRACPDDSRDGFKALKYHRWFQLPLDATPCLHALPQVGDIRVLAQFRCASHHLDCESGRHRGPRSERSCRFCSEGGVEDELHLLLCGAWQQARDSFPMVFESVGYQDLVVAVQKGGDIDSCMWSFVNLMSPQQLYHFAGYLKWVFKSRRDIESRSGVAPSVL